MRAAVSQPVAARTARALLQSANMLFHSWANVGRDIAVSAALFLAMVVMLRLAGQQSLAKMSGFDVVFTVTFGSVIATVAVTQDITLADGVASLATLLVLQEIIRRLQSRYLRIHHAVRESPTVVLWDGELLEDRLRASSLSADEVRAAVRKAGLRSLSEVRVVVLENDGDWSVVAKTDHPSDETAFLGLPIPGRPGNSPAEGSEHAEPAPPDRLP